MEYKMGMRLILFFTVWDIGYLVNCIFYKLQGLREKMVKFIPNEKFGYQNPLSTNQLRLCAQYQG